MSNYFINTLAPWQWAVLAAVPPAIIALYFLKLRRQPLQVPSTYLWHRTIEDLHANSLWQRLRQSLLLFLQILLLILAMLACLRPGWRGDKLIGNRQIFMLDTSASMSATDFKPSRLEVAKRRIDKMIDAMQTGDVAMIIEFNDRAHPVQHFIDNRRLLRKKLQEIHPTNRTSDLSEALRLASGLANPGRSSDPDNPIDEHVAEAQPATCYIFSDGRFDAVKDFSLGNLTVRFDVIGNQDSANVGIVAFSPRRNPDRPDRLDAFARLENYGLADAIVELDLYLDNESIDTAQVSVPAGGSGGVQFELHDLESGTLRLEIRNEDDFALDNTAYAAINVPRRGKVLLVTPHNEALETALGTEETARIAMVSIVEPKYLLTKAYQEQANSGAYDLVIYDQAAPRAMPQANTLFIGRLPPSKKQAKPDPKQPPGPGQWAAGKKQGAPQIIDTARAHPLMQFIELGNVLIAEAEPLSPPPGSTVLIDAEMGPIFAIAPRAGFEDAVMGFELVGYDEKQKAYFANTDWPIRRSFPLFVMNMLHYLGGSGGALSTGTVQPGQAITLRTEAPVETIHVESPTKKITSVRRTGQSAFPFSNTDQLGVYQVREGKAKTITQQFSVNLFDSTESNIRPRQNLPIGDDVIQGQTGWTPMRKEAWKYFLIAALVVLLVEWYIYNRRVYL